MVRAAAEAVDLRAWTCLISRPSKDIRWTHRAVPLVAFYDLRLEERLQENIVNLCVVTGLEERLGHILDELGELVLRVAERSARRHDLDNIFAAWFKSAELAFRLAAKRRQEGLLSDRRSGRGGHRCEDR